MAAFDLKTHADNAMYIIVAAIAIALAFGIGLYILNQLNNASGNQLTTAVNLLSSQSSLINTAVTFLFIAVVAGIGIGLVLYLKGGMGFGGK